MDMKLELVVLPVSDVDRAKAFYRCVGFREDLDYASGEDFRVVQFTPPGSGASIVFGAGVTAAAPGSVGGLLLAVSDHRRGPLRADRAWRRRRRRLPRHGRGVLPPVAGLGGARPRPGRARSRVVRAVLRSRRERLGPPGSEGPLAIGMMASGLVVAEVRRRQEAERTDRERLAQLLAEHLRLLPGGEVPALRAPRRSTSGWGRPSRPSSSGP